MKARGLCKRDYDLWYRYEHRDLAPKPLPLVCVCRVPVLGTLNECQRCFRKPAALLGVLRKAVPQGVERHPEEHDRPEHDGEHRGAQHPTGEAREQVRDREHAQGRY